jgi:hypothetical protein
MSKASKNTTSQAYSVLIQNKYIAIGTTEILVQISLPTPSEFCSDIKLKFTNTMWAKHVTNHLQRMSMSVVQHLFKIHRYLYYNHL